jgi:NitT/TauT family transport system ATP-binding protein
MAVTLVRPDLRLADDESVLRLQGVTKIFKHGRRSDVLALQDINLDVRRGEFVCILGASGCGKSTLLSLIADLDKPTSGRITSTVERAAVMFQEPGLLPWLTVRRNVELPLRLKGVEDTERRVTVNRLLGMVGLIDFADSRPHELSGGMRQRVALARALAQDSALLLMDEPFGALDAITRDTLHDDLTRIWQQTHRSIVFVTHNVREAVRLGDRVVLLTSRPGRVAQIWEVALPRPRSLDSLEVAGLAAEITARLRSGMGDGRG